MKCNKRHQRTIAPAAITIAVFIQIVAVASHSRSTESAAEVAGADGAVQSQWDDEPVERLEPAPKTERTSKKYLWEQQHAKTDAKGGLVWTPTPFVFESGASVRYIDFAEGREAREAKKQEELAPYIEAALARRRTRPPLTDDEIDIVPASRPKPQAAG